MQNSQSRAEQSRAEQSRAEQSRAERYDSLNGLRSISAILIIAMHVYVNFGCKFDNTFFNRGISSFGMMVYLFMIVSGFSMCCGYYDKILNGKISITDFYTKRYAKILPFFALLTLIDIVVSPSFGSFCEAFANMTLTFGLLPNPSIEVIGVGWTLGTIFVFYLLFPFFCYLLRSKKAAWISFAISVIYHCLCIVYFCNENHVIEGYSAKQNIIYCAMFFIAGGLIYLYKNRLTKLASKYSLVVLLVCIGLSVSLYVRPSFARHELSSLWGNAAILISFAAWLIYALNSKNLVLNNKITKFLSNISLEMYLSHMFIFRIIEKLGLKYLFGKTIISYVFTFVLTLGGTIVFAIVASRILNKVNTTIKQKSK